MPVTVLGKSSILPYVGSSDLAFPLAPTQGYHFGTCFLGVPSMLTRTHSGVVAQSKTLIGQEFGRKSSRSLSQKNRNRHCVFLHFPRIKN